MANLRSRVSRLRRGTTSLSSPMPGLRAISSVGMPSGQPPPGNCASSWAKLLGRAATPPWPSWSARQTPGMSAGDEGVDVADTDMAMKN